jgi:glycosyltransferase involved in cell wall biosynthesis
MVEPLVEFGAADEKVRLLGVYTHPVQYYAPLFRTLTRCHPEIDFEVLYITRPTPQQQGQGFGVAFEWDQDLMEGYRWRVFRKSHPGDDYMRWGALDAAGIGQAIEDARPDVVLLPGWNCKGLVRALLACNRLRIPVLYRGDTNLWQRPGGLKRVVWSIKNRLLLNRFSGFLAVGKRARIFLREHGVSSECIVDSPHAVDGARIRRDAGDAMTPAGRARVRAELGLKGTDFVVLLAGKLEPRKDPETAIRAMSELGADAVLVICGSGELEQSCRRVALETRTRVLWLGFRNQSELPRLYAAADALVLPSVSETWGLAVNEAMAVGTPCVVSDAVGCAPDLIDPGLAGEVFPTEDRGFLLDGLQRMRHQVADRSTISCAVRAKAEPYSLERAADGIAVLARKVARTEWPPVPRESKCRVLALCDGMAILGGMERRTMEILDYAASGGATVHCIISRHPSFRFRIAHRIERSGHTWSAMKMTVALFSGERSLRWALRALVDVLSSSATVLAASAKRRPSVVFLWSFGSALTNWPALLLLRVLGFRIVLRSGNAPAVGRRHRWIWKGLVDAVVQVHVANSDFIASQIAAAGIRTTKVRVIRNARPDGPVPGCADPPEPRVIYVGQVIPEKGILEFLEALHLLQQRGIRFGATLVGRFHGWEHAAYSGYKEAVRAKAASFPSGVVELLGEREDVIDLMQSASVHCCPSQERQREGLAHVVLQAKAAGIPSVVTPSGALPEMVRHKVDGWICRGFGPEELAEGLSHFLVDRAAAREAGREAGLWCDPAYLPETIRRQWNDVLCGAPDWSGASGPHSSAST